jgi:hypothetical protein
LRIASGAVGVSITLDTFLQVILSEDVVSEGANCAISSCGTGVRIRDAIVLIIGVDGEPDDTASAGSGTSSRAGGAWVGTLDGTGVG